MDAPRRVLVIEPPGAGKSWVATRVATCLSLPHLELDGFKASADFDAAVASAARANTWLLDGNWDDGHLAEEIWPLAELVVWIDLPRWLVEVQLAWRSAHRILTRHSYYGQHQTLRGWASLAAWSWRMVPGYHNRYASMVSRLAVDASVVRISDRSEARNFLLALSQRWVGREPRP